MSYKIYHEIFRIKVYNFLIFNIFNIYIFKIYISKISLYFFSLYKVIDFTIIEYSRPSKKQLLQILAINFLTKYKLSTTLTIKINKFIIIN
jgi:hypothetical protein